MRQQCFLLAHLVTAGCLLHLNEAFVYQRPRIKELCKGPIPPQFKNAVLHVTPTESDSSEAVSEEAYAAQMTIEPTTTTSDGLFFASVVEDTTDVLETSAAMDVPPPMPDTSLQKKDDDDEEESPLLTRRAWLQTGVFVATGTIIAAASIMNERALESKKQAKTFRPLVSPLASANSTAAKNAAPKTTPSKTTAQTVTPQTAPPNGNPAKPAANVNPAKPLETSKVEPTTMKKLEPVNITQVAAETSVNVTLNCPDACVSIDPTTMTKVKSKKLPVWAPSWLAPRPKVIKQITNAELLVAATIAGSMVDVGRTSLLYPIQTVKTRIQTDINNSTTTFLPVNQRMKTFGSNVKRHIDEGNLYAGVRPTLLVSVPATGIYYGVRDVSKKVLAMTPLNGIQIALLAALIGDIVSLCFRAPADTLRVRLQNLDEDVGDWFGDSVRRLPQIIVTDLPYLLSKITLNRLLIHGSISIDQYTEYAIIASSIAALLTTPFDVARTRILIDSDGDSSNGFDGGSGDGVIKTMRGIVKEGNGGYANLFAGWFERVIYLGLGRAWLEPIQLIGYIGIRDAVLLEWF